MGIECCNPESDININNIDQDQIDGEIQFHDHSQCKTRTDNRCYLEFLKGNVNEDGTPSPSRHVSKTRCPHCTMEERSMFKF